MTTNLEDTLAAGEYWAVFARGAIVLRFGPFTAKQFGEIVNDCVDEGIGCSMVVNCGPVVDWETIRQLMATDWSNCSWPIRHCVNQLSPNAKQGG